MHKVQYQFYLVASSSIILIFGIALTVFSIFLLYDQFYLFEILGSNLYRDGVYISAFSGILTIIICSMTYFGACFLNRFFIIITCTFQFLILLMVLAAGILVLVFDLTRNANAVAFMENSLLTAYNKTTLYTRAWDEAQIKLRCCAVTDKGWNLYRSSYWSANTNIVRNFNINITESNPFYQMVPESCCYRLIDGQTGWPSVIPLDIDHCQHFLFGPPRFPDGAHNPAVYYKGCFNASRSYIRNYSGYIGGLCLFTIPILILGIIASCNFLCSDFTEKRD